jgi:hypothetical protein
MSNDTVLADDRACDASVAMNESSGVLAAPAWQGQPDVTVGAGAGGHGGGRQKGQKGQKVERPPENGHRMRSAGLANKCQKRQKVPEKARERVNQRRPPRKSPKSPELAKALENRDRIRVAVCRRKSPKSPELKFSPWRELEQ